MYVYWANACNDFICGEQPSAFSLCFSSLFISKFSLLPLQRQFDVSFLWIIWFAGVANCRESIWNYSRNQPYSIEVDEKTDPNWHIKCPTNVFAQTNHTRQRRNSKIYNVLNFTAILRFSAQSFQQQPKRQKRWPFVCVCVSFLWTLLCISTDTMLVFRFTFWCWRSVSYANATWMINYSVWYPIWFVYLTPLLLVDVISSVFFFLFSLATMLRFTKAKYFTAKLWLSHEKLPDIEYHHLWNWT